jgi:hypothetical protein
VPRILSPEDSQVGDGDRVGLAHGGSSSRTHSRLRYTAEFRVQTFFELVLYSTLIGPTLIIDGFTSLDYYGVTLVRLLTFVPIAGP